MKKKYYTLIIIILVVLTLITIYLRVNNKELIDGGTVTLTGRFELPEPTKGAIAFLYTDDYNLGKVEIYPNYPESVGDSIKSLNGKNVRIRGKIKYVVCDELSQCIGEFWAIEHVDSIEIIE